MSILRILVVDDDQDSALSFVEILSARGYQADLAMDGKSALELVLNREYHVALLDFKLPDTDGATLFEQIKKLSPSMVAIMITAYSGSNGAERARQAGVHCVLRKPIDFPGFFATLNALQNGHEISYPGVT